MKAVWALVLVAVLAVIGYAGVAGVQGAAAEAERNRIAAETAAAALAQAQAKAAQGAALQARVASAELQISVLTKERDDAIAAATTGRACLSGRAVRVLDGAPGIRVAAVPRAAPGTAAAHATAAADPGAVAAAGSGDGAAHGAPAEPELSVTDTAIARWVLQAGALYEACRGRLDALIDYAAAPEPRP